MATPSVNWRGHSILFPTASNPHQPKVPSYIQPKHKPSHCLVSKSPTMREPEEEIEFHQVPTDSQVLHHLLFHVLKIQQGSTKIRC